MTRILVAVAGMLLWALTGSAQSPKREFRGAWIATVANIDWPSKPGLPSPEQQQQFISLLDELQSVGCNAVIVQVRPACDALYASKIEPWSRFLTGAQGAPPDPYYDPLTFMIAEAHKRNMEFHAWFNPFRALMDSHQNPNPPKTVTREHPDWIIAYGGKSYIDPGLPEARDYVVSVIADVVKRYDVDAVHLDDYFYPYKVYGQTFNDSRTYARYGKGTGIDDWRRENISKFISQLSTSIKHIKPYMKLGISPFGIWRNKDKDPEGSDTKGGQTNYDDLYADVLLWMQKGWIDYLMPQLYWEHASHAAPFGKLLPWWYGHCYNRHIYYGLGLYRMTNARRGPWASDAELLWQIRDIRQQCPNTGFAFFSATSFGKIHAPVVQHLRNDIDKYPALVPAMPWIDTTCPPAPVVRSESSGGSVLLKWQESNPKKETLRYVVYRFINNEPINLDRSDRILSIQQATEYTDHDARKYRHPVYIVTALNRLWNESRPGNEIRP